MIIPIRLGLEIGIAAGLLGAAGIAWHEHNQRLVAEGVAQEKTRVADSALKVVTPARIIAETALVHDVRTVTKLTTRFDTLRDSVIRNVHDTIQVVRLITVADSLAHACTDALGGCEKLRALLTTERDDWKAKAQAAVSVPQRSCLAPSVIGVLLGAGAGYLAHR